MAEITGITPQIKDKERCNIEVDGRFFCGIQGAHFYHRLHEDGKGHPRLS